MNKFVVRLPSGSQPKKDICVSKATSQKSQDDEDDARSHADFCKKMNKIPSIPTLVGHNVVSDFEGGSEVVLRVSMGQSLHTVIIEEIVKLAIEDLGGSEDLVTKKDDIYLMIDKKGALMGCIVCEQVDKQRSAKLRSSDEATNIIIGTTVHVGNKANSVTSIAQIAPTSSSSTTSTITYGKLKRKLTEPVPDAPDNDDHDKNEASSVYTDPTLAISTRSRLMGVKLVWVHPTKRRQAVASRLLDTARRCFSYGAVISIDCVAFSQPTETGFAFASRYCQSDQILAYA